MPEVLATAGVSKLASALGETIEPAVAKAPPGLVPMASWPAGESAPGAGDTPCPAAFEKMVDLFCSSGDAARVGKLELARVGRRTGVGAGTATGVGAGVGAAGVVRTETGRETMPAGNGLALEGTELGEETAAGGEPIAMGSTLWVPVALDSAVIPGVRIVSV
ncbi:MAG: hypothetical protein WBP81_37170 [Solirubrobacteraceae bacterium]